MNSPGSTTYFSPSNAEFSQEGACSGVECVSAAIVDNITLLIWLGLIGLVVVASFLYLPKARDMCREEWNRTKDERDALDRFIRKVSNISVGSAPLQRSNNGAAPLVQRRRSDGELAEIKQAYRDTVMSVPHYNDEYDEPLQVHMGAEFDEDLATAICEGEQFTPQLKQAVLNFATQARDERDALLVALDHEAQALSEANSSLRSIDNRITALSKRPLPKQSFEELQGGWNELRGLRTRCQDIITDRQRSIHDGVSVGRRLNDTMHFHTYLYHALPVTYPVLAEGTRMVDRIQETQRQYVEAITRRV